MIKILYIDIESTNKIVYSMRTKKDLHWKDKIDKYNLDLARNILKGNDDLLKHGSCILEFDFNKSDKLENLLYKIIAINEFTDINIINKNNKAYVRFNFFELNKFIPIFDVSLQNNNILFNMNKLISKLPIIEFMKLNGFKEIYETHTKLNNELRSIYNENIIVDALTFYIKLIKMSTDESYKYIKEYVKSALYKNNLISYDFYITYKISDNYNIIKITTNDIINSFIYDIDLFKRMNEFRKNNRNSPNNNYIYSSSNDSYNIEKGNIIYIHDDISYLNNNIIKFSNKYDITIHEASKLFCATISLVIPNNIVNRIKDNNNLHITTQSKNVDYDNKVLFPSKIKRVLFHIDRDNFVFNSDKMRGRTYDIYFNIDDYLNLSNFITDELLVKNIPKDLIELTIPSGVITEVIITGSLYNIKQWIMNNINKIDNNYYNEILSTLLYSINRGSVMNNIFNKIKIDNNIILTKKDFEI